MKIFGCVALLFCAVSAAPKLRVTPKQLPAPLLTLPSNATSIRADIEDSFNCDGRDYGYYADVENDCQLFHVCLPVTYSNGRSQTFRWSFICPEETVFNQEIFTCTRSDESIDCAESPRYYNLNTNFGDDMPTGSAGGGAPETSQEEENEAEAAPLLPAEDDSGHAEDSVQVPHDVPQELEAPQEPQPQQQEAVKATAPVFMYNRRHIKV